MIIYLKDKSGNDIPYENVETITFDSDVEGGLATFTYGNAETKTVELQMVDGDMCIVADDGTLLKEITILKPDTLVAENIKIGTLIAGVEGTFIGNGVEKTVDLNFIDDTQFFVTDDASVIDELRMDESNIGKYVKYEGPSGRYLKNTYYQLIQTPTLNIADVNTVHSTYLGGTTNATVNVTCNIGDLIFVSCLTNAPSFTYDEDWTLFHSAPNWEEVTEQSGFGNKKIHIFYKVATKETEILHIYFTESYGFESVRAIFPNSIGLKLFDYSYTTSVGANSITANSADFGLIMWIFFIYRGNPKDFVLTSGVRSGLSSYDDFGFVIDDTDNTSITMSFTNGETSYMNLIFALPIGIVRTACAYEQVTNIYIDDSQTVYPDENTLMETLVLRKPDSLIPENIISGINIGGIVGTYSAPKLYVPNSINFEKQENGLYALRVSCNQQRNGYYVDKVQILLKNDDESFEVLAEKEITSHSDTTYSSTLFYASDFSCGRPILTERRARFLGTGFVESDVYETTALLSLGRLEYNLTNVTLDQLPEYGFYEDELVLVAKSESGYYLPKTIQLSTASGLITSDYSYDYDTGEIVISPTQQETITVSIDAVDTPWLRTPQLYISKPYLTTNPNLYLTYVDKNAENTTVTHDGNVVLDGIADNRTGLIAKSYSGVSGASYGFYSDGSYYRNNNNATYSAALHQVNVTMKTAGTITITYVHYGYSSYSYAVIGKVDCNLSTSYSTDNSTSYSNVYYSFKGVQSTSVKTMSISVPKGEHFIQFKFIKKNYNSTSYYFKYYVSTSVPSTPSWSLAEYITNYGQYPLQIQSFAEGYTESDVSVVEVDFQPRISITDAKITLTNTVDGIENIDVYIDDTKVGTVPYVAGEAIDISQFSSGFDVTEKHKVYVSAIGESINANQSNSVTSYIAIAPVYGVSGMYSSTVALTRTDDAVGLSYTVNSDGTVTSDFDDVFPWNEAHVVYDDFGNKFVEMPAMYFRVTTSSYNISTIQVSKLPRSTGTWYKVEPFCYGCYLGYVSSSKLISKAGYAPTGATSISNFRTYASNNGADYHQIDLYHLTVMKFLWWIEFATKDSQSVLRGRYSGSGTSGGATKRNTGLTDTLTTPSGYITSTNQMRWHYIEDFAGNMMEFADGISLNRYSTTSTSFYSYATSDPAKFATTDRTQMGALSYPTPTSSSGCLSGLGWDSSKPFLCLPRSIVSNTSYNTYLCDYVSFPSSISTVYGSICYGESYYHNNAQYGMDYYIYSTSTYTNAYVGSRLMYRGTLYVPPQYTIEQSGTELTVTGFSSITQNGTEIEVE